MIFHTRCKVSVGDVYEPELLFWRVLLRLAKVPCSYRNRLQSKSQAQIWIVTGYITRWSEHRATSINKANNSCLQGAHILDFSKDLKCALAVTP